MSYPPLPLMTMIDVGCKGGFHQFWGLLILYFDLLCRQPVRVTRYVGLLLHHSMIFFKSRKRKSHCSANSNICHTIIATTILLESIKALVYKVYISMAKLQNKGKNLLVFTLSVLSIKNWLHASLHGSVKEFNIS